MENSRFFILNHLLSTAMPIMNRYIRELLMGESPIAQCVKHTNPQEIKQHLQPKVVKEIPENPGKEALR